MKDRFKHNKIMGNKIQDLEKKLKDERNYVDSLNNRLSKGGYYLMSVQNNKINVEEALDAFGIGTNSLQKNKNKMEELKECQVEMPEFMELIEAFKEQISHMEEHAGVINEKVNAIKDFSVEKGPEGVYPGEPKQNGILGDLWSFVAKIRECNDNLNDSKKSLIRFVG